jgi:hypothetical protein
MAGSKKMKSIKIIIITAIGLLSTVLTGCRTSPLADSTSAFGAAVIQVQTNTSTVTAMLMSEDMTLQAKQAAQGTMLKEGSFQTFDTEAGKVTRIIALQALANYATALKALATSDNQSNLQTAANGLMGDLNTATNSILALSKANGAQTAQITGICDAIFQLGVNVEGAILAHERNQALNQALAANQTNIDTICGIFSAEMDPGSRFAGPQHPPVFYDELNYQFHLQEEALENSFTNAVAKDDAANRLALATQFGQLLQKKNLTLGLCRAVGNAFQKLAEVHAALVKAGQQGASPDAALGALSAQIKTVTIYSQQLQTIGGK